MDKPAIAVRGVSKRFGKREVLAGVSLDIYPGQIVGLLGPSGAGKTTLVRLIAGSDEPNGGATEVDGLHMPDLRALERIGYMAQSDALYVELSGRQNLQFFGALAGLAKANLPAAIEKAATLVNLTEDLRRPVYQYSGGMKRRLSLAIALIHAPRILLLDEPTVGMDPVLRLAIWEELRRYAAGGAAILMTTHVMDEAERCNRVALLRDGRVLAQGTPQELKTATGQTSLEGCFLYYGGVR
jgi:ABC-2 type transport system ATP-binding protein